MSTLNLWLFSSDDSRSVKPTPPEEEFTTAPIRQVFHAWIKTGFDAHGKIAQNESYVFDSEAYADYGVNVGREAAYSCTGPYEVPNLHCDSITVHTNHPYQSVGVVIILSITFTIPLSVINVRPVVGQLPR